MKVVYIFIQEIIQKMTFRITIAIILLTHCTMWAQNQFELGTIQYKDGTSKKGYIQFSL